jgi:multicomponent K+:H+ antiporter subunit D
MISLQRGKATDYFVIARKLKQQTLLGIMFMISAMAVAGLPPFSGFLAKLVVLQSATTADEQMWVWSVILVSSLVTIVALSRAGTTIFFRSTPSHDNNESLGASKWQLSGAILLLIASPMLALFGASVIDYTNNAAAQLHDIDYLLDVMKLNGGAP